jgi:hypothetical protein
MKLTEKGEAFVARMQIVDAMAKAGTPLFAALAAGLEDDDWTLVYAAARRLSLDIQIERHELNAEER